MNKNKKTDKNNTDRTKGKGIRLSAGMIAANFIIGMVIVVVSFFIGLGLETLNNGAGSFFINLLTFLIILAVIIVSNVFMINNRKKKLSEAEREKGVNKFWTAHLISAFIGAVVPVIIVACMLGSN